MSEFIFAIIGLIVGGTVGVLVMSMCHVSKRADEVCDHEDYKGLNTFKLMECAHCRKVYTLNSYIENYRCSYCGSNNGGEGV